MLVDLTEGGVDEKLSRMAVRYIYTSGNDKHMYTYIHTYIQYLPQLVLWKRQ